MEPTFTLMEVVTQVTGSKTRGTAKAYIPGQTAPNMWDSTWMARNMATVPFLGLMAELTKESG